MVLLYLLLMLSNCGLQYFIVEIGGMERESLGHEKLRAHKRRDALLCGHTVIAEKAQGSKGRCAQDTQPGHGFRAEVIL